VVTTALVAARAAPGTMRPAAKANALNMLCIAFLLRVVRGSNPSTVKLGSSLGVPHLNRL
jgi:hypothetical protein